MNKQRVIIFLISGIASLPLTTTASQFQTDTAQVVTYPHDFSTWSIPTSVGGTTWFDDWNKFYWINIASGGSGSAYADLTVNGTVVGTTGDGATIYQTREGANKFLI